MALATVAQVDAILGTSWAGSAGAEEARLVALIAEAQTIIEDELGRPAEGGTPITEVLSVRDFHRETIQLHRWPVTTVTQIDEDGATLDAADYLVDLDHGQVTRRAGNYPTTWTYGLAVVTVDYTPATIGRLSTLAASIAARAFTAGIAAQNAQAQNTHGFKQLVIGRWSATVDNSDKSDPVAALELTDADRATIARFRDLAY